MPKKGYTGTCSLRKEQCTTVSGTVLGGISAKKSGTQSLSLGILQVVWEINRSIHQGSKWCDTVDYMIPS